MDLVFKMQPQKLVHPSSPPKVRLQYIAAVKYRSSAHFGKEQKGKGES